jgi:hypothetical protein
MRRPDAHHQVVVTEGRVPPGVTLMQREPVRQAAFGGGFGGAFQGVPAEPLPVHDQSQHDGRALTHLAAGASPPTALTTERSLPWPPAAPG